MNKFVKQSELGVQFFVAEGSPYDYKILSVHYSRRKAIIAKNGSLKKYEDE